ncbi:MAG: hypothetical protein FWE80_00225 [Oscillospiraceae bacterium]|nr:hypothetical protein [Oscillospiraceae bacterium]
MKLVLKGDTSAGKAFSRYLPFTLVFGILGVFFLIAGITALNKNGLSMYSSSFTRQFKSDKDKILEIGAPLVGGFFSLLAVYIPFLAVREAKRCFIDVYDDRVKGAYLQTQVKQPSVYIPFELTYDQIESVSSRKTSVYLQIAGRTLQCRAFNADQIRDAIMSRLAP